MGLLYLSLKLSFQNIAVDGSSSCIPGEEMSEGYAGDEGDVGDGSPMSIRSFKQTNSTSTTATSPKKRTKSPR